MVVLNLTSDQVLALQQNTSEGIVLLADTQGKFIGTVQPMSVPIEQVIDMDRALQVARSPHPRYTTAQVLEQLQQLTAGQAE